MPIKPRITSGYAFEKRCDLGQKTGKGVYDWSKVDMGRIPDESRKTIF